MDLAKIVRRTGMHSIVINENNQYLVLKRHEKDENDPNFWDLPGGGIDTNENLTEAIKREITEEANLSVDEVNLIGAYTCNEGRLQLCAVAKLIGGDLQLSHEHSDFQWLSPEEFISLKPAGLHLLAAQHFLKTAKKITTFKELMEK
jgi:8-oxo-dGTP diphosphatase